MPVVVGAAARFDLRKRTAQFATRRLQLWRLGFRPRRFEVPLNRDKKLMWICEITALEILYILMYCVLLEGGRCVARGWSVGCSRMVGVLLEGGRCVARGWSVCCSRMVGVLLRIAAHPRALVHWPNRGSAGLRDPRKTAPDPHRGCEPNRARRAAPTPTPYPCPRDDPSPRPYACHTAGGAGVLPQPLPHGACQARRGQLLLHARALRVGPHHAPGSGLAGACAGSRGMRGARGHTQPWRSSMYYMRYWWYSTGYWWYYTGH